LFDIPEYAKAALADYVENKTNPGEFLLSILRNDLLSVCEAADDMNRRRIYEYVSYVYNKIPSCAWGSREAVEDWMGSR
jgi:hypothetical protein